METIEILRQFIMENLVTEYELGNLDENQSLFETGIVDSMGILKVVAFIETEFQIQIDDEDLLPENFETLFYLAEMISKKNGSSSQPSS